MSLVAWCLRGSRSDYAAALIFLTLCATIIPLRIGRFHWNELRVESWFAFGWLPGRTLFWYSLPSRILPIAQSLKNPTVTELFDGLGPDLEMKNILLIQAREVGPETRQLLTPTPELLRRLEAL